MEAIVLYIATKILDQTIADTWSNRILSYLFPKRSYKTRLIKVINQTIVDYESSHKTDGGVDKFPFYHSQELFERLSSFVLFSNGNIDNLELDFQSNPRIIIPLRSQIDDFFQFFLDNVQKDQKLKELFIDENFKNQIFENAGKLNGALIGLISLKKDTTEIKKLIKEGNNGHIPKELSTRLPKLNKDKIVGRTDDLKDLKERLFDNKQVVLMNGMGGIGKTTLAMVYLTEYYEEYNHILWITSTTNDFVTDFVSTPGLLESLKLEYNENAQNTYNSIIVKLKSFPGKSLLIIDNATETLAEFHTQLPGQPNWHLMVTSRDKIPFFELKELGFLSETESVELFKQHYTREKLQDDFLKELVKNIEYHTLTIEILAKTAQDLRMSPEELNNAILENMETDVVVRHSNKKIGKILSYLTSTFDLSKLSEEEVSILKYISLLPSEFISYEMLEEALSFTKDSLRKLLVKLAKKGWILYNDEDDVYKLHQIIFNVVQSKYKCDVGFAKPLMIGISHKLELDFSKDNPISKLKWIPYGHELLTQFEESLIMETASLQSHLAVLFRFLGNYNQAKVLFEKAMVSIENNFGKYHINTARSYSNLGSVLQNLGNFSEAKELLEKTKIYLEKEYGEDHPDTARSYSNLATVLKNLGEFKNAKFLLERAMKSDEKNFGTDHPNTARCYSNLALVLQDLGELNRARKLLEKAVNSNEKHLSEDHPTTAITYSNLALVLHDLGDFNQAKVLLEKAMILAEKNFGQDHPSTASSYSNLATVLQDLGEFEQAKVLLEKAIISDKKNFGTNHPSIARNYSNLAVVLQDLGDFKEAKVLLEKAIISDKKNFGTNHPSIARNYSNLAVIHKNLGDFNQAKILLEKAMISDEKNFGQDHPSTAISYSNLATVLKDLGDFNQAKELYEKAYHIFLVKFGENHPSTKIIRKNLNILLEEME